MRCRGVLWLVLAMGCLVGVSTSPAAAGDGFCGDGIVDLEAGETCDPPGPFGSDCCVGKETPGCNDSICESAVCSFDSFCCDTAWDEICAGEALALSACSGCFAPVVLLPPYAGDCCGPNDTPGCMDPTCQAAVCGADPFCCDVSWDLTCAAQTVTTFAVECGPSCLPFLDVCDEECSFCGDTNVNPDEECDDGNNLPGDGCGPTCLSECGNGIIDGGESCDVAAPFASDCCEDNGTPGCSDQDCQTTVCLGDPFCCDVSWDQTCADDALADTQCALSCLPPPDQDAPFTGDCCIVHEGVGCTDPTCESTVCSFDPFCCSVEWDEFCVIESYQHPLECAPACLPLLDTCDGNCSFCGDGNVDPGEECDDGNNIGGDGCDSFCVDECGNEVIDGGEDCDPPGPFCTCCTGHTAPGCNSGECQNVVCAVDETCCTISWDDDCAALAGSMSECNLCCDTITVCTDECQIDFDGDGIVDEDPDCNLFPNSGPAAIFGQPVFALQGASDCCSPNSGPGCSDPICEAAVCAGDVFCCNVEWDNLCSDAANALVPCLESCNSVEFGWTWGVSYNYAQGPFTSSVEIGGYSFDVLGTDGGATQTDVTLLGSGQGRWFLWQPDGCPNPSWASGGPAEVACGPPSDCCVDNGTPGCSDSLCESVVCADDPFCCTVSWDGVCAGSASALPFCSLGCSGDRCRDNALP